LVQMIYGVIKIRKIVISNANSISISLMHQSIGSEWTRTLHHFLKSQAVKSMNIQTRLLRPAWIGVLCYVFHSD
jgi:hypothetical protein